MTEALVFWILAAGTVLGALAVVLPPFGRNPVHGALGLIGSFFCLAGLYVLLCAHLLAALQVIVYAGAIMVLFTFVIMLLNLTKEEMGSARFTYAKLVGSVAIAFVFTKPRAWKSMPARRSSIGSPTSDCCAKPRSRPRTATGSRNP